ncbi:GGDEF domain-containing protein [Treponema sp.]|uniref:sensor domain-containing diguanylate cyclase n=1 Tax=Treponema sp. TaxID=166 RepID=UPI00298DCDCA|nr:GGDEF domain-containing protein [Treponema sp.]MCQ2241574.1 GGDEF domain-containing protein [Treponema sp.]
MKKKISLFKNLHLNSKTSEEAMSLMYSSFYKILRLNLRKDCYEEIMVFSKEKLPDRGYSHNFSDWAKNFAMTGNIYKDDIEDYLDFIDIKKIKDRFQTDPKQYTVKYRRNINGIMRWVSLDLIPCQNYSEKNQIVYLYVRDIHESLSKELNDSHFLQMVSEAITRSYLACVYMDIESNTARLIYADEKIRPYLRESNPIQETLNNSINYFTAQEYHPRMMDFCNLNTLGERLRGKSIITSEYVGTGGHFCRANFIPVGYGDNGNLKSVIYTNRFVDGEIISLRGQLETEKALVECLTTLSGSEDFAEANSKILKNIGEFYDGDRAYIFKIDYEKQTATNEFEWCNSNAKSQKNLLQDIKLSYFSRWLDLFNKNDIVFLSNISEELDADSIEFNFLNDLEINSIIVTSFYDNENKKITGFMGIDNPKRNIDTDIVIRSAATYIMEEKLKQTYTEELYRMSYSDSMTKTLNRAAYMRDMKKLAEGNDLNTGILYADVNGLKDTNDTKGHEAGDVLIESAVTLLKKYFRRKKDALYRIGGDEFVVISYDVSEKEFMTVVANLKDILKSKWILSCGGAWFHSISDIDHSTKEAEKAMYKNKADYYTAHPRSDRRQ